MSWNKISLFDYSETFSVDIPTPAYGYEVEVHLPICISQAADGSFGFFDPLNEAGDTLGTYDYRVLKNALFRMDNTSKGYLNTFLQTVDVGGRACDFWLHTNLTPGSGFFPFGPDRNQDAYYLVRTLDRQQSGKQMRPFKWFEETSSFIEVAHGGGSAVGNQHSQGRLQIGAVTGLMLPQDTIACNPEYATQTQLSITGAPSSIMGPLAGDSWIAEFELLCNTYNAAALITQLTVTTRTADLTVVVPSEVSLFGADQSGGTFTCKWLGSSRAEKEVILSVKHIGYDQFLIPVTLWMKANIS